MTRLSIFSPTCRQAVLRYAARLAEAGLAVSIEDSAGHTGKRADSSAKLTLQWLPKGTQQQDWENETEPADSNRVVGHYLQTLNLLARDEQAATAFLDERGRGRNR